MQPYDRTDDEGPDIQKPSRVKKKKKILVERRYVGPYPTFTQLFGMYEHLSQWHSFRRYVKRSDAETAISKIRRPNYEYRIIEEC